MHKFVTTDMLENWKKNMTDWITDALDRKFSACDYAVTVLKVAIRTKSLYAYTVKPVLRGHL
jgi:disulfide oxidoreductase YuzD